MTALRVPDRAALILTLALLAALAVHALQASPACAAPLKLGVRGAILMDLGTGRILFEQDADEQIPPASVTKIMTMYLAYDRIAQGKANLKTPIKVSSRAHKTGGSRMFVKKGETLPLSELLTGMAVSSGNDASVAVAEFLGGDVDGCVAQMNAKARALGMKGTVFKTPHGLPAKGQVTTARDMLLLSKDYLRRFPESLRLHSTRVLKHNKVVTRNRNKLLGHCPGVDGIKTGWVAASGYNIVATARRGKTRLLAVVLGAENPSQRAVETGRLLEEGFLAAKTGRAVREETPGLTRLVRAQLRSVCPIPGAPGARDDEDGAPTRIAKSGKARLVAAAASPAKAQRSRDGKTKSAMNVKAARTAKPASKAVVVKATSKTGGATKAKAVASLSKPKSKSAAKVPAASKTKARAASKPKAVVAAKPGKANVGKQAAASAVPVKASVKAAKASKETKPKTTAAKTTASRS